MQNTTRLLLLIALFFGASSAYCAEFKSTASDQNSLALTVYNGGRALVKEQRQITLNESVSTIAFMDVAEKIMPQTVAIQGIDVLEQNYDYDLLSPQALIQKNIGNKVRIARRSKETGETVEWIEGTILSTNGGIVLRMADGSLESLAAQPYYHMVFDKVPDNLRTTPTLSLLLREPVQGTQQLDMAYLTSGLDWQSDYVLQLDASESRADLTSWITLNNQSGIGYRNAKLQLLAGDVNMQPAHRQNRGREMLAMKAMAMGDVSEQALHGFHLYTVPHKTTINDRQSKQIKLFDASAIPVQKKLRDRAHVAAQTIDPQKSKPEQFLALRNSKPALGLPIPKGVIRVYAPDTDGNNQFIGEDGIDHTAVNDDMEIRLGKSFDISVQRKTTQLRQPSKKQQQIRREIKINNGSEKSQRLKLSEVMPTAEWQIRDASHDFLRDTPTVADFVVTLPAQAEIMVTYEVMVTYP